MSEESFQNLLLSIWEHPDQEYWGQLESCGENSEFPESSSLALLQGTVGDIPNACHESADIVRHLQAPLLERRFVQVVSDLRRHIHPSCQQCISSSLDTAGNHGDRKDTHRHELDILRQWLK